MPVFDIKKTIEKFVKSAITTIVAFVASFLAKNIGLELSPDQQATLVIFLVGLLTGLANLLKHKYPKYFKWL